MLRRDGVKENLFAAAPASTGIVFSFIVVFLIVAIFSDIVHAQEIVNENTVSGTNGSDPYAFDSDSASQMVDHYLSIIGGSRMDATNRQTGTKASQEVLSASADQAYTFYDLNGVPSAYVYTIRHGDDIGYIALSPTSELPLFLSSSTKSHPVNNFEKSFQTACSVDPKICEKPDDYLPVYLGIFYFFFVFDPESDSPVVVEAITSTEVPYDLLIEMQNKHDTAKRGFSSDHNQGFRRLESQGRKAALSSLKTSTISGVPEYTWYRGCTTTTSAMILSYYGLSAGLSGLAEQPDSFQWTRPQDWLLSWLITACNSSPSDIYIPRSLADELATYMYIPKDCGWNADFGATPAEQASAMKLVARNHGYSSASTVLSNSDLSAYMKEIDEKRPVAVHFNIAALNEGRTGRHSAAGYGYSVNSDSTHILFVNNTWNTGSNGVDAFTYETAYNAGYMINFVTFKPVLPATLRIDGSTSSTKAQGDTFNFTGSNYTSNGIVKRYMKKPGGATMTLANVTADNSGSISWGYTSSCADAGGTYYLWATDASSGKTSNQVTQVITVNPNCSLSQYEGWVDSADCNNVTGWAWDKNMPNTPISIDIYDGSTKLITKLAGSFRQDLLNAGKGNGYHAFAYTTPSGLKDSKPHSIYVKYTGTNTNLSGSPKVITCSQYAPSSILVSPLSGSWTTTPQNVNVSSINATAIYYTIRTTLDGTTPSDPPEPSSSLNDGYISGSSGIFQVYASAGQYKKLKVRFRAYNSSGYGPSTASCLYTIDLRAQINPTIAQSPMSGPPGTTFSQRGAGFTPNSTATLHFRKPDGTEYPTASQPINSDGTFSITYTAPTSKAPGTYSWWAIDGPTGKESNTVSYTITVSPVIAQTPMSGPPGTTFSQWGTGFTANSTATLHFRKPDGTEYPTASQPINSDGTFSITYTAPANKPRGNYTWWAIDGPTGKISNYVTYSIN